MDSDEEARLDEYFWRLALAIPDPPPGWEKNIKPCKWDKILRDRTDSLSVPG